MDRVPLNRVFTGPIAAGMQQTVLDQINDNREPATDPYMSLSEVSDARILYWCEYLLGQLRSTHPELTHLEEDYQQAVSVLRSYGVTSDHEGFSPWTFGVVTRQGIFAKIRIQDIAAMNKRPRRRG